MPVQMKPVDSSNLKEVGYDDATSALYVQFQQSGLYEFEMVPRDVYEDLLLAPSVGKFFNQKIKGAYKSRKIGGSAEGVPAGGGAF